eukprot:TRINITY_DN42149_c0_g1_i1.p1 TRINITY_DN42149_c0_g1~~TRINITY_DN42149_c0_g1_i1.p1  ORF type:complete len:630 (+),score=96.42 TRINITY_DN42149_c0_g1_i1:95-1891(+)
MQPDGYLSARLFLAWLQFLERDSRAFCAPPLLIVATGAAHSWAVVYALFIAIHTRAMRVEGYHLGYHDHLPGWVRTTETLSVASMFVWWAAGFTTATIRILDDDQKILPMEARDAREHWVTSLIRARWLHTGLAIAHTVSCVGLFVSILLLCIAMAGMAGGVTCCESCICIVAVGFAVPHALVAYRRLGASEADARKKADDLAKLPTPAVEAAAQEAASIGPQLCVILALADAPGHAYFWQNSVYVVTAILFVSTVVACGYQPPKALGSALPPQLPQIVTCAILDVATHITLLVCLPHLNNWFLWSLTVIIGFAFIGVYTEIGREITLDLLEPVFVVSSDSDKALPGPLRDTLRGTSWAVSLLCAAVTLWDVMLHPVNAGMIENTEETFPPEWRYDFHGGFYDGYKDEDALLLVRWRPSFAQYREGAVESVVAQALNVSKERVVQREFFLNHRVMVFRVATSDETGTDALQEWKDVWSRARSKIEDDMEADSFPAFVNKTLCSNAHDAVSVRARSTTADEPVEGHEAEHHETEEDHVIPAEIVEAVGDSTEGQAAMMAVCNWWTEVSGYAYRHVGHDDYEGPHLFSQEAHGEPEEVTE